MRFAQSLAALAGLAVATPFAVWVVTDWFSTISAAGWFAWVMGVWAACWVAFFAWHVVAPAVERRYYERLGRQVIRRSGTSAPGR